MNNLEIFVDRLMEEKNLPEGLEKEVIDQMKSDLLKRVEDKINAMIIANLAEDKIEEFSSLLDSDKSDEEVQGFLNNNIKDLDQLIAGELIVFRQTYLS